MYREQPAAPPDSCESFCYFCGRAGRADQPCAACLVEMPAITCRCGLRCSPLATACSSCHAALREPELPPMPCPACAAASRPAGPLARFGSDDLTLHGCTTCRGVFVSARAWCSLVLSPHRLPTLPATGAASAVVALLHCPLCRRQLERGRFAGLSAVTVDLCDRHGLWLDAEELPGVLRFCVEGEQSLTAAERAPAVLGPPMPTPNMHLRGGSASYQLVSTIVVVVLAVLVGGIRTSCTRAHRNTPAQGQDPKGAPTAPEPAGQRP